MALTISLDSAFIVLTLGGKSFTLTAPEASASTDDDDAPVVGTKVRRRHIRWQYHETYDKAVGFQVGNATGVIQEIQGFLPPWTPGALEKDLVGQWDDLQKKFKNIPVLSNAAGSVLETIEQGSVKITDLGLELDLITTTTTTGSGNNLSSTSTVKGHGVFTIGLAFTPSIAKPIRLFALNVTAFGAVLSVKLDNLKLSQDPTTNLNYLGF
jgi:hypothetical protein